MNINRNNYEEYFLLYADNELNASAKQMVEHFVQQNIDLEEEFVMLQQAIVKPDKNISLKDKSFLLRNTDEFINSNNYEAVFVLLNDNELSQSQIKETENFIRQNPALQNQFDLVQKAKLQPDTSIVFPDKNLLYKKEKGGKVVLFKWWRAIAAAVILGSGLWFGINYLQKEKLKPEGVAKIKTLQAPKAVSKPDVTKIQINPGIASQHVAVKNIQNKPSVKTNPYKILQNKPVNDTQLVKNNNELNKKTDKSLSENVIDKNNNDVELVRANTEDKLNKKVSNYPEKQLTKSLPVDINMNTTPPILYAKSAANTTDNHSNNYVFYNVTTEEFSHTKIGGFLKKLKRNIVRRSPFHNNEPEVTQQ